MKINFKKIIKLYFLYFSISISAIAGTTSYQITSHKVLIVSKTNEGQTLSTDMFLPGLRYKSSKDWWALSCNAYESEDENYKPCKISKTTLSVKRSSSSNRMGEDDTTGQMLHWQPSPPIGTLLMFKPSASILTKQVAGTVPTYYSNPEHALFTKEGSISTYVAGLLEAELILPGGIKARFLPVIVLSGKARSLTNDQIKGRHTLELRIGSKHQTLIGSNFDFYSRESAMGR